MIDFIINKHGDLVIWHFSDSVDRTQTEDCYQLVKTIIEDVKPGFTLITDLLDVKNMDVECAEFLSSIMDLLNQAKVARVYRIISNTEIDIGWKIMDKFHFDSNAVLIQTFPTFFEAIKIYLIEKALNLSDNNP